MKIISLIILFIAVTPLALSVADESPEEMIKNMRILFLGDTCYGESYHNEDFCESRGYNYFMRKVAGLLRSSDMTIANLETPLTDLEKSPLSWKKNYTHWGSITETPVALTNRCIRFVSLANNHTMDYGAEGLNQTMLALRENGIDWFGAGLDSEKAGEPLRADLVVGGRPFKLIVVSGYEHSMKYNWIYHFYAGKNKSGVNRWKRKEAAQQIRNIRDGYQDAFIVAFPHWGKNYKFSTRGQRKLAHALIEAGCDLVIGHGAHIMQEIEYYRGKWILYGLGNFVFNSPGRYQKLDVDPFSLAAGLDVADEGNALKLTLRLYPIFSDNLVTDYQPRLVTAEEIEQVKSILIQHSPDPAYLQREMKSSEDRVGLFLDLDIGQRR